MALVVLLKGVNVGGHRTFRPSRLVAELAHLDVVNIGAAGTFVVRRPAGRARLRAELARHLPFETEIVICEGREILRLLARDPFAGAGARPGLVRFVSFLSRAPRRAPPAPFGLPPGGAPLVTILAREGRFVIGIYRRRMQAIAALGALERIFGVPVTTRQWSTVAAIAGVLAGQRDGGGLSPKPRR